MAKIKNKQELINKIKNAEGFSNEEKSQMLALLNENKTYGLVWEKSTEDAWEIMKDYVPVLKEDESKRIDHGSENPNHILIEGDNLNALTALSYTHEGKVDVIYIDPPYNTGNKDFIYNDSFVDAEDSYRHSKWLSFMEKRLKIASRLLSDKGVIFISIDDNEQAQLKVLSDEIFNVQNFVATFIWIKKKKGSHLSKTTRSMTEYVLCYSKNFSDLEMYGEKAYSDKQQPLAKRTNAKKILTFDRNIIHTTLADGYYKGLKGRGTSALCFEEFEVKNGLVISPCVVSGPFIWTQPKLDEEIGMGTIINLSSKFGFNVLRSDQDSKIKRPSTLIDNKVDVGTNEDAYDELINIFGEEGVMSYPKPVSLIKYLLNTRAYFYKDLTVLDFFAGSGTTLHATMQLNAEDGGHRQCILVTNNENNICEEVTYERNKRVIEGYTKPNGEFVEGLKDNNLRYFKVDFAPREKTHQQNKELFRLLKDIICIKDDVYREQHQFGSLSLAGKEKLLQYFEENGKQVLIVYDARVIPYLVNEIENMDMTDSPIMIYVFADGVYPYTADFTNVLAKVKLIPMPYAFLRGIKDSLPEGPSSWVDNSELTDDEKAKLMEEAIKVQPLSEE